MRRYLRYFHTKPDTTESLEAALTQRIRRGLRLGALVGLSLVAAMFVLDFVWPSSMSMLHRVTRGLIGLMMLIAALIAPRGASYARTAFAAALLSLSVVAHALINIADSGGARSSSLPVYPIAIATMTYILPMRFRLALLIYPVCLAGYSIVILTSSASAPVEAIVNAFRWGILSTLLSMAGAWLNYRVLRDTYDWRIALREESRRAALALERTRIARDLHDHIGARLTGIALRAEREQKRVGDDQKDALVWIQDTVRLCLEELRDTIWALSSSGRDARELVATLRRRAEDIADTADMTLEWQMDNDAWHGYLSAGVSVALSAIVREALTNTLRHSGAKTVRIALERDAKEIRLEIADDGRGLGESPSEGRGLGNMRTRAKEQNGDVVLEANGERGVKVIARIPIGEARAGESG
ncbi:MAG: sensor histidine kinase [Deltaproteobacteria bacterium]|nr:sensor histidine kinase [Deltaproteobacteria bacterium]